MQKDHKTREKTHLKLIYPYWIKKDNKRLVNLVTNHKIDLSEAYKQMLATALATNLLADPCTEYDVLTRTWALELMEQGFLILDQGLIDSEKYLLLRHNKV